MSTIKKKILLVTRPLTPPWDEASKNFAHDLARHFEPSETLELHIMVTESLNNIPSHVIQHPVYTHGHFDFMQKLRALLFQFRHRKDFDIMHYMFTPTKLNAWIVKVLIQNPKVKTIQTLATLRDDLYDDVELSQLFFADTIVTYSRYRAENLSKIFPLKNISTIYPGIDFDKFQPKPKDTALMEKWNINQNDFIVTYPGEFIRLGATDMIIDAFFDLWKDPRNHHVKYLCACRIKNDADAAKKKNIIARLEKAGHHDKVIFTDTFGDMNSIYNLSDVVIFPVTNMSGKFDVPLAIIEAYACKKLVITSDMEIFVEFSNPEINVIIPSGDKNALADAITTLRDDPAQGEHLGENAFTFTHKTFDIKKSTARYRKLYEQL